MRLSHLLPSSSADTVTGSRDPEVTGLTADSRAVKPGFVFAALAGAKADGRAYIADALAKGAAAILAAEGTELPAGSLDGSGAVLVTAAQPRLTFARMAASFHGRQPGTVIAVTGTNGKTSTVQFAAQIWERLGLKAASLGTLGLIGPGLDGYGGMTTPDPVTLHKDLAAVASAGIDHLAMEASSHGLEQFRLDGVALKAAGFTNLTRDHFDYHGSMEAYRDAKAMLFGRVLPPGAAAVLNADSYDFQHFADLCTQRGHRLLSYGLAGTELRVNGVEPLAHGQRLALTVLGRDVTVDLPLAGRFQAWNVLCALGLVIGAGADTDAHIDGAVAALSSLEGVPGRLQHVATHPNGAAVYVDFAHTPDALETVLTALRSHAGRHLVTVFGCGGDRDRGKRPVMGELAARLADRAIVTDDNPRTEDPAVVRGEVLAGGRAKLEEVGDRAEAIRVAVRGLQPGDVLVIAGKGHEQGQTIGTEIRPFDDADEARKAVAEVGS